MNQLNQLKRRNTDMRELAQKKRLQLVITADGQACTFSFYDQVSEGLIFQIRVPNVTVCDPIELVMHGLEGYVPSVSRW